MATNNSINTGILLLPANNLSDTASASSAILNLFVTTAVTTTANLTSSNFGQNIICTGSSAYTVTLTAHSAGKFIQITCLTTSNALLTIATSSGTISNQTTIILGSGDSILLQDDGTNYWIIDRSLQPVNARIYLNTTQAIGSGVTTRILYDTATYDIGPSFDLVTNIGRATPLWPGKYEIVGNANITSPGAGNADAILIFKNGSLYLQNFQDAIATGNRTYTAINYLSMNGSTDFVEIQFKNGGASSKNLSAASTDTYVTLARKSLF